MNFQNLNSIFKSDVQNQSHRLSFPLALKLLRKEINCNVIWRFDVLDLKSCENFDSEKEVFALGVV